MAKFKEKNVLITGGASGIGKIMGELALKKGASAVIIWDINQENINSTITEFNTIGKAFGFRVDVSNEEMVAKTYAEIKQKIGQIDILINCAGIVTSNKTFEKYTTDEIMRTMKINAIAPMLVALQVLPDMVARNSGHICTIASAGGMISNPKMSVYSASKWAAIGWSDSVRIELQEQKSKVRITTIAPYYITTGMFDGVKSRIIPLLKPHYAAKQIIKAIESDKKFKVLMRLIPCPYHFIRLMQGLLPSKVFDWVFGEVVGIYHTMDNFTGRK